MMILISASSSFPLNSAARLTNSYVSKSHSLLLYKTCKIIRCSSSSQSDKQPIENFERLFSNLNQATMKREPGSVTSGIFLVVGTTIGAGILAIPAVTKEAGFIPSTITCILCWIYMVVTGLLIAEVNVNTMCELGSGGVSLVSMAKRTLGRVGVQVTCWESATLFSLLFGGICYFGSQRVIGAINGFLIFGILASFSTLVGVASGNLQWNALLESHFEAIPQSIPIIALSFIYQNVVPVLCTDLEGDLTKVRTSIVFGTAIPLILFLVWDGVILGTIPTLQSNIGAITDPLEQLRLSNGVVGPIVDVFSFLAIGTSYIGFVLGLVDFVSDLLKQPSGQRKPLPYILTLLPPLVLSLLNPQIFFKALDFAGTYGDLVLFGVLPAAMSWSDRYSTSSQSINIPTLVPGGKFTLAIIMGGALSVIFSEVVENFVH